MADRVWLGYLAPAYRDHPDAAAWEDYLNDNCRWSVANFGGGWAWETAVPPRAEWEAEAVRLNAHLAEIESADSRPTPLA
jgi:hypothetical protein